MANSLFHNMYNEGERYGEIIDLPIVDLSQPIESSNEDELVLEILNKFLTQKVFSDLQQSCANSINENKNDKLAWKGQASFYINRDYGLENGFFPSGLTEKISKIVSKDSRFLEYFGNFRYKIFYIEYYHSERTMITITIKLDTK